MDTQTLAQLDQKHVWHPFTQHLQWAEEPPLIIERAHGCRLIDTEGTSYIDGVSSLWTNVHGHRHPDLDRALKEQTDRCAHSTLLGLSHVPSITLAAELANATPAPLSRVFFSDNGSTATESALKIAFQCQQQRGQTQRTRFAALRDAYHGDTLGAVSVGSIDLFHRIYRPLLFDAVALPAPVHPGGDEERSCLERATALLDAHADTLAAFIFEPLIQGASGMKMHTPAFISTLATRARERGVLLIADEVAVGFGRTGTLFAIEQLDVVPDIICLAKGLGAGYLPIAATITTDDVFEAFLADPQANQQFFHGHTFSGNPLACAVAIESLRLFGKNKVLRHVSALTETFARSLSRFQGSASVSSVRQRGVMIGIDLDGPPLTGHRVAMACRTQGAIVRPLGNTLVINPPLALTCDDAAALVSMVERAIEQCLGGGSSP